MNGKGRWSEFLASKLKNGLIPKQKKNAKMAISCTWKPERTWILQRFPTFCCWKSDSLHRSQTHAANNRPAASTACNNGDSWNLQNKHLNLLNLRNQKGQISAQSESTKFGMFISLDLEGPMHRSGQRNLEFVYLLFGKLLLLEWRWIASSQPFAPNLPTSPNDYNMVEPNPPSTY